MMTLRTKPLVLAAALGGIFLSQNTLADTIRVDGFWGNTGTATVMFDGTNYHTGASSSVDLSARIGGFETYNLTTDAGMSAALQAWCVDIFRTFNLPATTSATMLSAASIFGVDKASDLGRLYTNQHGLIDGVGSSATNQSAFQLAVWEIVNEGSSNPYDLRVGNLRATSGSTGFTTAQSWLNQLNTTASASQFDVNIWSNTGRVQDLAVFAPAVPEPQTYAMMLAGLGLLGFMARRRKQAEGKQSTA
jgi:hypothetical protein